MNKNYTPGTWHLKEKMSDYLVFPFQGDYPLAEVYTHRTSEGESNAQLISAAPDLVEALIADAKKEAELQNAPNVACGMDPQCFITWEDCLSEQATTALAKAGVLTKDK